VFNHIETNDFSFCLIFLFWVCEQKQAAKKEKRKEKKKKKTHVKQIQVVQDSVKTTNTV
jgi:hypothetical protein